MMPRIRPPHIRLPRIRPPRLLPITIFALGGLLAVKSAELVRSAAAAAEQSNAPAATSFLPARPAPAPASFPAPGQPVAPPAADDTAAPVEDGERTVLLELRQRREQLDGREAALAGRESLLTAAERKLAERVAEMQALQTKLEALDASRQERDNAGWQGLVKLYEAMKPRDAATIFNELGMPVLLQVVDRMKEAKAAPVLAAMQPDKARDVTAQLARLRTRREAQDGSPTGG
jgi:flagellar motility protein MotE (MotC chaperone)